MRDLKIFLGMDNDLKLKLFNLMIVGAYVDYSTISDNADVKQITDIAKRLCGGVGISVATLQDALEAEKRINNRTIVTGTPVLQNESELLNSVYTQHVIDDFMEYMKSTEGFIPKGAIEWCRNNFDSEEDYSDSEVWEIMRDKYWDTHK